MADPRGHILTYERYICPGGRSKGAYINIWRYIKPVNICPGGRSKGAYINRRWICQRQHPILHSANTPSFQNHPCCNIVQRHNVQFKTRSTGISVALGLQTSQKSFFLNHFQNLDLFWRICSKNVYTISLIGCSKQQPVVAVTCNREKCNAVKNYVA